MKQPPTTGHDPLPAACAHDWRAHVSSMAEPARLLGERIGVHAGSRWISWTLTGAPFNGSAFAGLGHPGLWVPCNSDGQSDWTMEIPRCAVVERAYGCSHDEVEALSGREHAGLSNYFDWVLSSALGKLPPQWIPPDAALVEQWMPSQALTVRQGATVRQGELILHPTRWAIRVPIVASIPNHLPAGRESALRELVCETQAAWRMVRLGFMHSNSHLALVAEVDLSGAPHAEHLFLAGLDAVRHVVQTLVEPANLLANASIAMRALEIQDHTNTQPKEKPKESL